MVSDGWVKIHRKVLDNPIVCKDSDYLAVWVYLLLNATHKEYEVLFKGAKVTLGVGSLVTGRLKIAKTLNVNEYKVERILKCFENEHQIAQQTSNKNRIITVLNWNKYQIDAQQNEQQLHNNCTTTAQQLHTNKNIKNIENVKNNNNPPLSPHGGEWDYERHNNQENLLHFLNHEPFGGKEYILEHKKLWETIKAWMEYKDEKGKAKKRYSVKSIPRLLNEIIGKCKELGEDSAVSAIDKSIGRGYIGITWELAERRSKESEAMRRWIEQDSQGQ